MGACHYCLAAFHSASGRGVRLLFRIPPVQTPAEHKALFKQVTQHVRAHYKIKPDMSGSDVARASFVSYSKTMVINLEAQVLPVTLAPLIVETSKPQSTPVRQSKMQETPNLATNAPLTHWHFVGSDHAPGRRRPDGTYCTHDPLFKLARRLARHAYQQKLDAKGKRALLDDAFAGWWRAIDKRRLPVRRTLTEYRKELTVCFEDSLKVKPIGEAATVWTRWLEHPDFPHTGTPRERLLFAIQQHCHKNHTEKFFISTRDAGKIISMSNFTASHILHELRKDGVLSIAGRPLSRRHASSYQLNGHFSQ